MKKSKNQIKKIVRKGYAKIARQGGSCCSSQSCCGGAGAAEKISKTVGYTDRDLSSVPDGANVGLGCGNPVALASLQKGDIVLDLGSGAGLDAFLAARKVGKTGKVIGVDMTPAMVRKARENARKGNDTNVEFRLGEIEQLPVENNAIDVIISNCVINLSPDKEKVFQEAYRVLKTGGRLMVSDLVLMKELPDAIKRSVDAYVGCLSGALMRDEYLNDIKKAGFSNITVIEQTHYPIEAMSNNGTAKALQRSDCLLSDELVNIEASVVSITISAKKGDHVKIEIFGTGCAKCNTLEKNVKEAVKELNVTAEVVKVSDINEMINRGVMLTPALFVNGKKKSEGKVPSYDDIKKIMREV